jgi:tRNA pseudouridine13 synthase
LSSLPRPRVVGRIKVEPEDFVVDEIPMYPPSGEGEHVWILVEKRDLAAHSAVMRLAEHVGIQARRIGYAGLKDARAVTRQWWSLEGATEDRLVGLELPGLRVLEVTRHRNRIKIGHLRGNRFRIRVRGAPAAALDDVRLNLAHLTKRGLPNWFGAQRFGREGNNVARGLSILDGDLRAARIKIPSRILRLILSALQSEVFNRVLRARLANYDGLLDGDIAWLHRNGACFRVESAIAERIRAERFEISASGPLPGPKCLAPGGDVAAIEAEAVQSLGLDVTKLAKLAKGTNDGARRPLRVPLSQVVVEAADDGFVVGFELPRGSFATAVLEELLEQVDDASAASSDDPDAASED